MGNPLKSYNIALSEVIGIPANPDLEQQGAVGLFIGYRDNYESIFTANANATTGLGYFHRNIWVNKVKCEIRAMNAGNSPCEVTWYFCRPRVDQDGSGPWIEWQNEAAATNVPNPPGGPQVPSTFSTGAGTQPYLWKSTPFQITGFCKRFKIVKVKKVFLKAGSEGVHSMRFTHKINKLVDIARYRINTFYRAHTLFVFPVINTFPILNTGATPPTVTTFAEGAVTCAYHLSYRYRMVDVTEANRWDAQPVTTAGRLGHRGGEYYTTLQPTIATGTTTAATAPFLTSVV